MPRSGFCACGLQRGLELGDLAAKLRVPVALPIDDPAPESISHALTSVGGALAHGINALYEALAEALQVDVAERQELGDGVGMAGKGVPKRLGSAFNECATLEVGEPRAHGCGAKISLSRGGEGSSRFLRGILVRVLELVLGLLVNSETGHSEDLQPNLKHALGSCKRVKVRATGDLRYSAIWGTHAVPAMV
jgi:hypothetical protein